ncbi:MAG: ComF family protein [Myxococcota bacterium]
MNLLEVAQGLLELVFPPHCIGCAAMLPPDRLVCDVCDVALERMPSHGGCPRCADLVSDALCARCTSSPPPFARVDVGLVYGGTVKDAIRNLKFHDAPWIADALAELAFPSLPSDWSTLDALVPVPLHVRRHRERGYNQARLVAVSLARRMDKPILSRTLQRVRNTAPVAGLAPEERATTVRDAFRASGVAGKRVALVDDVVTTSATVREAASALMAAGAREVIVVAIARGGQGAEG